MTFCYLKQPSNPELGIKSQSCMPNCWDGARYSSPWVFPPNNRLLQGEQRFQLKDKQETVNDNLKRLDKETSSKVPYIYLLGFHLQILVTTYCLLCRPLMTYHIAYRRLCSKYFVWKNCKLISTWEKLKIFSLKVKETGCFSHLLVVICLCWDHSLIT